MSCKIFVCDKIFRCLNYHKTRKKFVFISRLKPPRRTYVFKSRRINSNALYLYSFTILILILFSEFRHLHAKSWRSLLNRRLRVPPFTRETKAWQTKTVRFAAKEVLHKLPSAKNRTVGEKEAHTLHERVAPETKRREHELLSTETLSEFSLL